MAGTVSKTILSVVALIVGIGTPLFSQNEGIRFELIPGELSRTGIEAIAQDHRGFLWVGTFGGLVRYDGYSSRVFRHHPADANSLSDNQVGALCETNGHGQATLWIGTSNGLNRFDPEQETFVRYKHDPGNPLSLSHNSISFLMEDRHGNLWIGTGGGGLCRLNTAKNEAENRLPIDVFTRYTHDPDDPATISSNDVLVIFEDNDGSIWVGTTRGGLNRFDPGTETFIHYPVQPITPGNPADHVSAISVTRDAQELWVGSAHPGNLLRITLRPDAQNQDFSSAIAFKAVQEIGAMSVSTIYEDRNGTLWVGTPGGLLEVNRKDRIVSNGPDFDSAPAPVTLRSHRYDPADPNSLSDNHVLSLFEDRSGTLWVGTTSGLHKLSYSTDKFVNMNHEPDNANSVAAVPVTSVWVDELGWLWLGTSDGLNAYDPEHDQFLLFKHDPADEKSLRKNYIGALYGDRSEQLWVGTFGGGLSRLDLDTFHRTGEARFDHYIRDKKDPHSLEGNFVYAIHHDRNGNLWVGGHGLSKLSSEDQLAGKFTVFYHDPDNPSSLPQGAVMSILEDRNGNIWLGGNALGLVKHNPDSEQFIRFTQDSEQPTRLSNNNVAPIYEDASGYLWLGTDSGLDKFDPRTETFSSYFEEDGLPHNAVSGILGDDDGNLWISTEKGLCRFNEKLPEGRRFRNYDVIHDLQGNMPYFNSYHQSKRGEMFFGGTRGITRFYPAQVKDNQHLPPVAITDFKLFNEPVLIGGGSPLHKSITESKEITLSHKHNFFSFEFAALDYTAPGKNQYAYMMEGFDADWIDIGSRRYANYTNLDPGQYTFRVKGSNNDGVWNENGASIRLLITPPFWQTWWFTAIGFILVGSILYGLHVVRLQRTLEIERIRSRIASDLHDDIGAGLTHIGLLSEVSLRKTGGDRVKKTSGSGAVQELSSSIERVGSIARELSLAMGDVVWSINPNHDSVESLQHRLTAFATEICAAKKIKLNIDVSERIAKMKLNPEIRRHLLLFAKEALHNTAKYSESDLVNLKIEAGNKNIVLEVADFGKGFDLKNSTKGNGLVNMRSRVEKMGGECEIDSQIGKGTKIKATVPFKS